MNCETCKIIIKLKISNHKKCRECYNKYHREWMKKNPGKNCEYLKKSRTMNRKKHLENKRKWYRKNIDRERKKSNEYYFANREKTLVRRRELYKKKREDRAKLSIECKNGKRNG